MEAIRDLKNSEAPGQDQLNAVLFKCHPELIAEIFLLLCAKVRNGEGIPSDWSKGVIMPTPNERNTLIATVGGVSHHYPYQAKSLGHCETSPFGGQ